MKSFGVFSVVVVLLTSSVAKADLLVSIAPVNNSAVSSLANYRTQDILAQTSSRWYNAELLVSLTRGSIYQDSFGGDTSPNPAWVGLVPSLAFDTFVTAGHIDFTQQPSFVGGAVDLAGGPTPQLFNTQAISATWATTAYDNSGLLTLARLTLSNDAAGSFGLIVNNAGGERFFTNAGVIQNGQLTLVPEPSAAVLFASSGLALAVWAPLRSRRRK